MNLKKILSLLLCFLLISSSSYAMYNPDDTDDKLCRDNVDSTLMPTATMTACIWAKPLTLTTSNALISHGERTAPMTGWRFGHVTATDELIFTTQGVADYQTTTLNVVAGEWQYICANYQSGDQDVRFYIYRASTDAISTQTITGSSPMNAPSTGEADLAIGTNPAAISNTCVEQVSQASGYYSNATVWDTTLTSDEILTIARSRVKGAARQMKPANIRANFLLDDYPDGTLGNGRLFKNDIGTNLSLTGDDGANNTGCGVVAEEFLTYA